MKNGKSAKTKIPQSYEELFPGRFLKGAQFKGAAAMLTIKEIFQERIDDEWAVIVSFEGINQQLALNKTNGECLKGMFGTKIAAWLGKRVTFYPRMVKAFGKTGPAVRILGSPDIKADMRIEVNAGEGSGPRTMKKTEAKKWTALAGDAEGPEDFDPDTGEVPFGEDEVAEIHEAEMGAGT